MDQPFARVLVMARAPVAGSTKTRLEPLLGPDGCARLQTALVRHTVSTAEAVAPGAVFVAVAGAVELVAPLAGTAVVFGQCVGDLGARLLAAVRRVRAAVPGSAQSGPVVVVGTDCPQLGVGHLVAALRRVAAGAEVVFGPAHDGGYYLAALGHTAPAGPVFDLPAAMWGGPQVLALSRAAAERAGLRTGLIGIEHDLDTPDDAATALTDPRVPAEVAALLRDPRAAR